MINSMVWSKFLVPVKAEHVNDGLFSDTVDIKLK